MPRSDALTLTIKADGENMKLRFDRLQQALRGVGIMVIKEARKNLRKQDKVVTGELYDSLQYHIVTKKEEITIMFDADAPYWDFVNQGIKGTKSSAKAPKSEYQFGTGSYTGTQTLRGGIDRWVIRKPIEGVRDSKTGRFIPRKQLVRMISNSVWTTGIKPSNYYTLAFDSGWKKSKKRIGVAIGLDVDDFVSKNLTGNYTIDITL